MLPVFNILFLGIFIYPGYKKNAKPAIDVLLAPMVEKIKKSRHHWAILLLGMLVIGLLLNSLFISGLSLILNTFSCRPGSDADCGMAGAVALVVLGPTLLITFLLMNGMLLLFTLYIMGISAGRSGRQKT